MSAILANLKGNGLTLCYRCDSCGILYPTEDSGKLENCPPGNYYHCCKDTETCKFRESVRT